MTILRAVRPLSLRVLLRDLALAASIAWLLAQAVILAAGWDVQP